jgi:hypothetical protein
LSIRSLDIEDLVTDNNSPEGHAEEDVALRWFCAIGAVVTFIIIAHVAFALVFGPRTLPLPWPVYVVVGMSALCFILYINVIATKSPCSCAPSDARARGTLLTVCTFIVIFLHEHVISAPSNGTYYTESWKILVFCVANGIPLVSWCSGVSGLGLWPPGERWTHAIVVGILPGILALFTLGLVLFIVVGGSRSNYIPHECCLSNFCYCD